VAERFQPPRGTFDVLPADARRPDHGDTAAREIVERAGSELGSSAALVARRLLSNLPVEVVLAGGLFRSRSALLESLIWERAPGARLVRLASPPVAGAVLMAMELNGGPGADAQERLSAELAGQFA